MSIGNDYDDYDDPYDPDMTVSEALNAGLIAVIDTGKIGSGYYRTCGMVNADLSAGNASFVCTRNVGHDGVHAFVVRWHAAPQADMDHLAASLGRLNTAAKGASDAMRAMNDALAKALQREKERAEQVAKLAELAKAEDARRKERMRAALADREGPIFHPAVYDEIENWEIKAVEDEKQANREDSIIRRGQTKTWADLTGSSKRKFINPKGQRR